MSATVYLNGEYLPLEQAKIPVLDRGFIFGDGVYEVIPVYGGKAFRLSQHLQRLQRNLDAIKIAFPLEEKTWQEIVDTLVSHNSGIDQSIYLQITRGVAARNHTFPQQIACTVFAMSSPLQTDTQPQGIEAISLADIRWQNCHIKSISLLANVLLKQQAKEAGAEEAILYTRYPGEQEDFATEGSASNLFVVQNGTIITPPKSHHLLPGITRDLMVELAHKHHLPLKEDNIFLSKLATADEIWISSSTKEIVPIVKLDKRIIGDGTPGPVWQQMIAIYQQYKQQLRCDPRE